MNDLSDWRSGQRERRRRAFISKLTVRLVLGSRDGSTIARFITRGIADSLPASRATLWLLSPCETMFECVGTYGRTVGGPARQEAIRGIEFKKIWEQLSIQKIIVPNAELVDGISVRLGTEGGGSGLATVIDCAIRRSGRVTGFLRAERIGKGRRWEAEEISFISAVADEIAFREATLSPLYKGTFDCLGYAAISTVSDGTITLFNAAAEYLLGYDAREVVGQWHLLAFFSETEVRERMAQASGRSPNMDDRLGALVVRTPDGLPDEREWTLVHKSGRLIPALVSLTAVKSHGGARTIGYAAVITSVAERNRTAEKSRQAEESFAQVLSQSPDVITVTRLSDQKLIKVNPGFEATFEVPEAGALGATSADLNIWVDLNQRNQFFEAVRQRGEVNPTEILVRDRSGQILTCVATAKVISFEGEPCVLSLLHDVTRVKRWEEDLINARLEAEAASNAKAEFLANMSHELRTPLNAIIGFSEVLAVGSEGQSAERTREYANYIRDSGVRLLNLISDMLDAASISAGRMLLSEEWLDVPAVVDDCVGLLHERATAKGIEIRREIPSPVPSLWADGHRIRQILISILSNAIKFSASSSRIAVSVSDLDDGSLEVMILDQGIGMDAGAIPLALEPFSQVSGGSGKSHEGAGIGLYLVRQLMEAHSGWLTIESALGIGTSVRLRFPSFRVSASNRFARMNDNDKTRSHTEDVGRRRVQFDECSGEMSEEESAVNESEGHC